MDYGDLGMDPEVLRMKAAAANRNGAAHKGEPAANGNSHSTTHILASAAMKASAKITSATTKHDVAHAVATGVSA